MSICGKALLCTFFTANAEPPWLLACAWIAHQPESVALACPTCIEILLDSTNGTYLVTSPLVELATALCTGEQPSAFPQRRLMVDFSRVDMNERLDRLLAGLLQPAWEDRLTAAQARDVLEGKARGSQQQRRQQQDPFSQNDWENARQRARGSSSGRQVNLSAS